MWAYVFNSLGYTCRCKIMDWTLCLTSGRTARIFSKEGAPFYILPVTNERSTFSTSLSICVIFCLFYYSYFMIELETQCAGTVPRPPLQSGPSFLASCSCRLLPPLPSHTPGSPFAIRRSEPDCSGGRDQEVGYFHLLPRRVPAVGWPLCVGQLMWWAPWGAACVPTIHPRFPAHHLAIGTCRPGGSG